MLDLNRHILHLVLVLALSWLLGKPGSWQCHTSSSVAEQILLQTPESTLILFALSESSKDKRVLGS